MLLRQTFLLLVLFAFSSIQPLAAHLLNMSNVTVSVGSDASVGIKLELDLLVEAGSRQAYFELSQIREPMGDARVQALLERLLAAIVLEADGQRLQATVLSIAFAPLSQDEYLSPLAWPRAQVQLAIPNTALATATSLQVRFLGSFRFEEPIATTITEVSGGSSKTRWLVIGQNSPAFLLPERTTGEVVSEPLNSISGIQRLFEYLPLGFFHILPDGADHLLFVLALCLSTSNIKRVLVLISLFTVAHTVSLGAVSLALIPASPRIVEPLILLTIIWAAINNLISGERPRQQLLLVFGFGLIHGMGFAGALRTIGLPAEHLLAALLGFNLGVEAAQIAFIVVVMVALYSIRGLGVLQPILTKTMSLFIAVTGTYWMGQLLLV